MRASRAGRLRARESPRPAVSTTSTDRPSTVDSRNHPSDHQNSASPVTERLAQPSQAQRHGNQPAVSLHPRRSGLTVITDMLEKCSFGRSSKRNARMPRLLSRSVSPSRLSIDAKRSTSARMRSILHVSQARDCGLDLAYARGRNYLSSRAPDPRPPR